MKIRQVYNTSNEIIAGIIPNQVYEMMRRREESYLEESGLPFTSKKERLKNLLTRQRVTKNTKGPITIENLETTNST